MKNTEVAGRARTSGLAKLGNTIRGDLEAAGKQARASWTKLVEPQVTKAEKLAKEVGRASRRAITRGAAALDEFKTSLTNAAPAAPEATTKRAKRATTKRK